MSAHQTSSFSLAFWNKFQLRLDAELATARAACTQAAKPLNLSIDAAPTLGDRLKDALAGLNSAMALYDGLATLQWSAQKQLSDAEYECGVTQLRANIALYQSYRNLYLELAQPTESRVEASRAFTQAAAAFASASKAAGGEWAAIERGRLLALNFTIPVVAGEEAASFAAALRNVDTQLLTLTAQLDSLLATRAGYFVFDEALVPFCEQLGVTFPEAQPGQGGVAAIEGASEAAA